MSFAEYRLFLSDAAPTAAQLARFEDITVEQEMDMAWEARLQVPLCLDTKGRWSAEDEKFLQAMSRIRIEIRIHGGPWMPLIDGPIVTPINDMQSEPGNSMATIVVRDDSVYLHRNETVRVYQNTPDDRIARELFQVAAQIDDNVDADAPPAAPNPGFDSTVLRGTEMELLQLLARRQHMHAYVLPGNTPGKSKGYFKYDPQGDSGLPTLTLLGNDRNLLSLRFRSQATQPALFRTSTVSLEDVSVVSGSADASDIQRLGTDDPDGTPVNRMLHPGLADSVNPKRAAQGASEQAAYSESGEGEVMREVYTGVLRPYQNVQVLGANGRLSGLWLITQVTHTLTRNSYGQTFRLARNARSAGTGTPDPGVPPGAF